MKLAMVEWVDPCSVAVQWQDIEPFIEKPVDCISCGILLHEDEDNVHLGLNMNSSHYSQGMVIPKCCIKRLRYLKVANGSGNQED